MTDHGSLHNLRRSDSRGVSRPGLFTHSASSFPSFRSWPSSRTGASSLSVPSPRFLIRTRLYAAAVRLKCQATFSSTDVSRLPEDPHRLHPAEDLFHPFSDLLTEAVARMTGGAAVDGRSSVRRVLGHVRGASILAALARTLRIINFVRPKVMRWLPGSRSTMASAASRSAVPVAGISRGEIRPWRFSISTCPMKHSLASLPLPLRNSRASGSVVEACVWFSRFSHESPLPGCAPRREGGGASLGRKLFRDAQPRSACRPR